MKLFCTFHAKDQFQTAEKKIKQKKKNTDQIFDRTLNTGGLAQQKEVLKN